MAPPGSPKPIVRVLAYDGDACDETVVESVEQIREMRKGGRGLWVDVQGVGDAEFVRQLGELFNLHLLSLEDVLNLHQRPKVDTFDHYIYCVLRMPDFGVPLRLEQMSVFFGKDFVVTFSGRSRRSARSGARTTAPQSWTHSGSGLGLPRLRHHRRHR